MRKPYGKICIALLTVSAAIAFNINSAQAAGSITCTLTDTVKEDKSPGDPVSTFPSVGIPLLLICTSEDVTKGDIVTAKWINDTYPERSTTTTTNVESTPEEGKTWTGNISLTSKSIPPGSYHIDITLDGNQVQTINFTVEDKAK